MLPAGDRDRSGRRVAAGERSQERRLPVSDHARDADDLARSSAQRDVVEAVAAQSLDPEERAGSVAGGALRREGRLEPAPDDQRQEIRVRDVLHGGRATPRAVAERGNAIRYLAHLRETVRDVDDRGPVRCEGAYRREEKVDRVPGEGRCRLVEDQEPWRDRERLGELEQMPSRDAQGRDAVLEVAEEVNVVEQ